MTQCAAYTADPAATAFLAADVGGTHARLGLVHRTADGCAHVTSYTTYIGADYASLGQILHRFMAEHEVHVSHCVLACAGYMLDGVVINQNLPWAVDTRQLRQELGLGKLSLINDFEALAYATPYIDAGTTTLLSQCSRASDEGPVIVVGPGTGLGSAVLVPGSPRPTVLPTEAGQINLAPGNELEARVRDILAQTDQYVSYEHVLSGPGLLNLYRALGKYRHEPAPIDDPRAITRSALRGDDALARQTLDTFCALLGSFVSNLAMLYNASGGIYLAGGIVPHIRDFLARSDFLARFLAKGQTRAFLERVPIRLIEHGQLGVVGAASWYLQHLDRDLQEAPDTPLHSIHDTRRITVEACQP